MKRPAAVRGQQVEELCAAGARALSGEAGLHFRGRRPHHDGQPMADLAPHLQPSLEHDDLGSFRGTADALGLRLKFTDAALHRALRPAAPIERLLFNLLEQVRVESLASEAMPGVVDNLRHRHEQWSTAAVAGGLTDSESGLLLYTVAQMVRARVLAQPVFELTEGLIEATRMAVSPQLGHELAGLRRERHDQGAYAQHALSLARRIGEMLLQAGADAQVREQSPDAARALQSLFALGDLDGDDEQPAAASAGSRAFGDTDRRYRVFTTAYDVQASAASLVRAPLLREYREQLDRRIAAQGVNVARLARELAAMLARPRHDGWDAGQETGRIDGRRLAQLVASPTERRLFRIERAQPQADCVVSFLIDCSGSMKQHAESVAMLVDVLARALEQAGAVTEILGFSTGAWNGGRALRDWRRSGRPPRPGRLNEALHLVFKEADTPWRRARPAIAGLLKADLFREGVDGEAVEWAASRLAARAESRRLLIVVSDGCPMDAATSLANGEHYLDEHLQEVVARLERSGQVEVAALGVGLDLSPYYRHNRALDIAAPPGNKVFGDILELIGRRRAG